MRLKITVKQANPNFNKEYAIEYHKSQETPGNTKSLHLGGRYFDNVKSYEKLSKQERRIELPLTKGENAEVVMRNLRVLHIYFEDGHYEDLIISSKILKTWPIPKKREDKLTCFISLKDTANFIKVSNLVWLDKEELDEQLLKLFTAQN